MDDYAVRTSLIQNIQGHRHLVRHNQDAQADVTFIVNGLAEMRFSDGTWALLTFIDNALARVPPAIPLKTQLEELRQLLVDKRTNSSQSSPPASTPAPLGQIQQTTIDNPSNKENNKADILLVRETQPDVAHIQPSSLLQHKIETQDFDVFLSYNSGDRTAVKKIGEDLKKHGILPWLDVWELRPGLPWQRALEQQIRTIKSAAVFVGKTGMGPWHLSEMDALLRQFKKRNCPVIPVLLPDAPQEPELPIFLEEMSWVDFRKQEPDPFEELLWGITGQPPLPGVDATQEIQPAANTIVYPVHFWKPVVDDFYTMAHTYFDDIGVMHTRVVEVCNPFIKGQLIWPDQHQRTIKSIVELAESADKFSDLLATIDQTSLSGADVSPQQLLKLTIGLFAIKRHIRDLETHAAAFPNNGKTLSKPLMRQQMLRSLELLQQSMKEVQSIYTSIAPTKTPVHLQVDTLQTNLSITPDDSNARGQIVPIQRQPIKLSDPDKDALASSLLKCPCISDSNRREAVLRRLPENIRNSRIKDSRQDIDVQNIVEACANYPGGIESLIAAVRFYDKATWQMLEVDAVLHRIMLAHPES